MRAIMILTAVSAILVGCAESNGGSDNGSTAAPITPAGQITPPTNTQPAPTDYSKVACSQQSDCADVCDVTAPKLTEDEIRNNVCSQLPTLPGATCDALVASAYATFTQPNTQCRAQMVTSVIKTTDIGATVCSSDSGCSSICHLLYQPTTDDAIKASAAAKGLLESSATLKALLENHLLMAQVYACLDAPKVYVIRSALPQAN